jgi:hypothetical protein
VQREQPSFREVGIWPAFLIIEAAPDARSLVLFAQERAKPAADELVEIVEGAGPGLLEVAEPAPEHPVEIRDDDVEAVAPRPPRPVPDGVLELVQLFLRTSRQPASNR